MANEKGWSSGMWWILLVLAVVSAVAIQNWLAPLVYRDSASLPEFRSLVEGCVLGWFLSWRPLRQSPRIAEWWRRSPQAQRWVSYGGIVAAILLGYRDPRGLLDSLLFVVGWSYFYGLRLAQRGASATVQS